MKLAKKNSITLTILLTFACALAKHSGAAEVTQQTVFKNTPAIRLTGTIVKGDYERIRGLASNISNAGSQIIVSLNSPGGDFEEALRIAELLRELNAQTYISGILARDSTTPFVKCYSACFLIHASGSVRHYVLENMLFDSSGNRVLAEEPVLGIHRPYLNPEINRKLSASESRSRYEVIEASARKILGQASVPQDIVDTMFRTSSNEIYLISRSDFDMEIGQLQPYYQEWLKSKCGKLEGKELEDLARVEALKISSSNAASQPADLSAGYVQYIVKKQGEIDQCASKAVLEHQRTVLRSKNSRQSVGRGVD
ncbi:MAG TPA: hypothetical protein PLS22_06510 [Aquabacterium sp.]|nr:hypothetical protein [Aquabacterium sp.]